MYASDSALIIGNGPTRKQYRLKNAANLGLTTFGCNRIIDEFTPDYVIAIDPPAIKYLMASALPKHKLLVPVINEHWEPPELHGGTPQVRRSNAGCNAVIEAIRRDFLNIYMIGFDYLLVDQGMASDNVFADKPEYANPPTPDDNMNRIVYFKHILGNAPDDIHFHLVFPKKVESLVLKLDNVPNLAYHFADDLKGL